MLIEVTDPMKYVYQDISVATYLIVSQYRNSIMYYNNFNSEWFAFSLYKLIVMLQFLQLCRMALPLMNGFNCLLMEGPAHPAIDLTYSNTPTAVTQLLLAKLAEYMSQMLATHLPPAINSLKWVGLVLLMVTAAIPQP